MIVGPGEGDRHLPRALDAAKAWADGIEIVDDSGEDFRKDESLVRNRLMWMLDQDAHEGDLVVILDADEVLEGLRGEDPRPILERMAAEPAVCWGVTFFHLWAPDGSAFRLDGAWAPSAGVRIYRHVPGARIEPRAMACSPVPLPLGVQAGAPLAPLRIAHWGYARPEDRPVKYERYRELDGGAFHASAHIESIMAEPTLVPFR